MDAQSTSKIFHRVEDLWFADGSIVLLAEHNLFRVSKSILGARSTVFSDMLSSSHPDDGESMDGCPLVHLYDSAAEVTYFLKAIYDSSFFESRPALTDYSIIAGVLRLSHKYDVPYLRKRALSHLDSAYPTNLAAWDNRDNTRTFPDLSTLESRFSLLRLATEVGALWILPTAIYECCSSGIDVIVDVPGISAADRRSCIIAYPAIQDMGYDLLLRACSQLRRHCIITQMLFVVNHWWRMDNGLLDIDIYSRIFDTDHDCHACATKSQRLYDEWRSFVWNKLPTIVASDSTANWENLKELKARTLE